MDRRNSRLLGSDLGGALAQYRERDSLDVASGHRFQARVTAGANRRRPISLSAAAISSPLLIRCSICRTFREAHTRPSARPPAPPQRQLPAPALAHRTRRGPPRCGRRRSPTAPEAGGCGSLAMARKVHNCELFQQRLRRRSADSETRFQWPSLTLKCSDWPEDFLPRSLKRDFDGAKRLDVGIDRERAVRR
jgi:hypothetical protein